jgi:hypothetical protein
MQKAIFAVALAVVLGVNGAQAGDLPRSGSLRDVPDYMPGNS